MKNDVYALLYAKGTKTGRNYTESAERKKRTVTRLLFGLGLPLLISIGYLYVPAKLSVKVTDADRAAIKNAAEQKKLEVLYSNAAAYDGVKDLAPLGKAFQAERPKNAPSKAEAEITALVKGGADILAYHSVGRIYGGKVADYDEKNFKPYSGAAREVTRNPNEFLADLEQSRLKDKGTVVVLIGSGREHYNILPDGSTDPDCSAGILTRFFKEHPEYSDKLKVIFFHPYSQEPLFGQPEYEAEKYGRIPKQGWYNAFLGIALGKDDLSKPLIREDGWKNAEFWAEGPGIENFSGKDVALDKQLTDSRLLRLGKADDRAEFYWLPWSAEPKDGGAAAELARSYGLVFVGYRGTKPVSGSERLIPAKIMGSR